MFKKILIVIIAATLFLLPSTGGLYAVSPPPPGWANDYAGQEPAYMSDYPSITIFPEPHIDNVVRIAIGENAFILNDRTMVPLRYIAENFGAEVGWDGETRTVSITSGDVNFTLTIGVPLPDNMGVPVIENSRTFVPLAYIADMLGASTRWDGEARAVYIINERERITRPPLVIDHGHPAEDEPPEDANGDQDEPPAARQVIVISGGTEHAPHEHFVHGAMYTDGGLLSASGLVPPEISYLFETLPIIKLSDDFEIMVEYGEYDTVVYTVFGYDFEETASVESLNDIDFPGYEFILLVDVIWRSEPDGNEFTHMHYYFRIGRR